ncbi:MAG: hypothetical protein HY875_00125 [Chloroflexi bacterium]|nr:hypothetical protein [Chloroflexota bacterium]
MADPHAQDPNAAPMHHEIKERFTNAQAAVSGILGAVAIIAGIVLGIVLAND